MKAPKPKAVDKPTVIRCAKCHAILSNEKACKCDAGWYTEADKHVAQTET